MLETVGHLRAFLVERGWSPEDLSARVPVSNMTWRRLLAKPDELPLPKKYRELLHKQYAPVPDGLGFPVSPEDVVITGMEMKPHQVVEHLAREGDTVASEADLLSAVNTKKAMMLVPMLLVTRLSEVMHQLPTASRSTKMLILGGLLYFLNPMDLIADAAVAVGFIDDVGVLGLIGQHLRRREAR